ncbi:MAG: hypothetical protein ACFFBI_10470, partial [Promethearchaeota archaeon]
SYIKGIVPQIRQQEIFNYTRKRVKYNKGIKKSKFKDENLVKFKDLIKLEANFKPNVDAMKIPEGQAELGG